jgi:hypothetical protein
MGAGSYILLNGAGQIVGSVSDAALDAMEAAEVRALAAESALARMREALRKFMDACAYAEPEALKAANKDAYETGRAALATPPSERDEG